MENLKPTNISSFYAHTGNSTKIADFGSAKKIVTSECLSPSTPPIPELPNRNKKDNTWLYILGGIVVVCCIAYLVNSANKKDEEKDKKKV